MPRQPREGQILRVPYPAAYFSLVSFVSEPLLFPCHVFLNGASYIALERSASLSLLLFSFRVVLSGHGYVYLGLTCSDKVLSRSSTSRMYSTKLRASVRVRIPCSSIPV